MTRLCAAAIAALSLWISASALLAQDVTLRSRDGSVEITGTLLGFDGQFYRVDSEYGVLTVDGQGVTCAGPGCPSLTGFTADIAISGAATVGARLIPVLIESFARSEGYRAETETDQSDLRVILLYSGDDPSPAARFTIRLNTSAEAFADLISEEADMALSLREPTQAERMHARAAGLGDLNAPRQSRVLALDALVPLVHPTNSVRRLGLDTLAALFAGNPARWSAVGGEDAPVNLYLRDPAAGFGQVFAETVVARRDTALSDSVSVKTSDAAVAAAVAADPFGLGVASFSRPGLAEIVTLTGECGFEVAPTPLAIKAGDYPLATPIYLYRPAVRLPQVGRDFLRYLRSASAGGVIRRVGLVDQTIEEVALSDQGARLANAIAAAGPDVSLATLQRLVATMDGKERLTLTYRFSGGSTALDAPSRSNVALLAAALDAGQFDARRLVFVGFSDGQGAAALNQRLAERRAEVVRRAVAEATEALDATGAELVADAFGEALPMACDDSDWGRSVNRRVEVWVD